jgi:hypothetical protein
MRAYGGVKAVLSLNGLASHPGRVTGVEIAKAIGKAIPVQALTVPRG